MKRPSLLALVPLAFLFLLSVSVRPVWARAMLENPQPNSAQSGISVISGWACDANRIEIIFNETDTQQAGYGTRRTDTQGVCGDTDNGFGLLFNWNKLGNGTHTVRALADGVEFGSATVTVTTFGEEMLRGVSEAVTVSGFPTTGSNIVLRWQESQQNFVITTGSPGSGGTSGSPPRVLENPQPGSFQSGVGVISGWVCDASQIEIEFNNDAANRWPAGYGTQRTDTRGVCGDTDNGFGLLFNWNKLGAGTHTVRAFADGTEFARATVTVTTLGQEFVRGVSKEVTLADFPHIGTDSVVRWQEAQQNFVIALAAPTQRLVDVSPDITIPTGVTSVQAKDVSVTSLHSPTGQVRASPDSTLLLAKDSDGTVLLSIADMDGGLLGEGQSAVEVSLASTAVTLVALAAGYSITAIDQSVVDQITAHANYPALLAAMKTALAADKNFLDRIFDYPEVVRLIRSVATFRTGVRQAGQATQQMHQMLSAQSAAVPPTGIYKDNFWCARDSSLLGNLLCSPWYEREPWQWFGDAKGVKAFYPDNWFDVALILFSSPFGGVSAVSREGYQDLLIEATHPPFLARSHRTPGLHATANPNFITYALELYSGTEYKDWHYTSRNSTIVGKLRNSGAAYRSIPTGPSAPLNPTIDRVRFERYRLSGSSWRAVGLSFLNGFQAMSAVINIFSDVSAVTNFLDKWSTAERVVALAECVTDKKIVRNIPADTSGDPVPAMLAFTRTDASSWLNILVTCDIESLAADLARVIGEQTIRSYADAAAVAALSWAKLAFDTVNDTVPVFTSYLSPNAGSVEYYIQWEEDAQGNPYIARVSKDPPPSTSTPDLIVESPSVSVNSLTAGQGFTLSVTVRNQGTEASPNTRLRYYRSSDATITRQDTQLDTDLISSVNPSSTRSASASLTAPSTAGTYYYGACVDGVTNESDTTNNCSSGVRVTVEAQAKPTITSVSNASATEGSSLTFTVQLSGSTTQRETYYYSAYNGTAESGDYAAADEQTVQVSSGNSSFTIQVRTNQDADTDDETFYLYVTGQANHPNSAPGSSQYRATGTIRDDDSPTTDDHGNTRSGATSLSVGGSQSGQIETGSDIDYFRVQVSGSGTLTVYTTGSLDTVGRLENSSGSSLSNDDDSGNNSNFRIAQTVSAGTYYVKVESHGSNTGSYTLHASFSATSSTPQVSIADASATEGNALSFTVTLSPAPTQSTTYYYATYQGTARGGGQDYQGSYATALTFSSGQTSKTISVSTVDDTEDESDEQFYVYITDASSKHPNSGTPSDYLDSATGTIRDNDDTVTPQVSIANASATEGNTLNFTVTLSPAPTQSVTYYYATYQSTARGGGQDYQGHYATALTFSSGQTSKTISVSTIDDTEDESDEQFYVYITDASSKHPNSGTPSDYLDSATGTIRDNDEATPTSPDLIVSSASLDDTTVEQGDRIRIDVTIRNQGDGRAGSSRVGYYTTINGSLTLLDYDSVSSLNAGSSADEYERLSTSNLAPGTYCIGVRADYRKRVDESDETNNNYTSSNLCFTVTTPALPDLIVSSASLDATTVKQGDRIRIDVTVKNQGDGEAGRSRVGYYISSGNTLTLLDYDLVSSLDANESSDEYENLSTSSLSPGAHCIGVRADYQKSVDESDETNNNYTSLDICFTVTAS